MGRARWSQCRSVRREPVGSKVSIGMDCTTDLAVPARLSKRAKQRCVRDYRPCHCWYFLITL